MQLQITRIPSEEPTYSVVTGSGTRYDVHSSELKRWLVNLGVDDSTINAVLEKQPNETTTVRAEKAASA